MAIFVMLSDAAVEEANGKLLPTPYQHFFLNEILGESPGCEYDGNSQDFTKTLWYAFTQVTQGDYSRTLSVNLDPDSWYSPESIVNVDATIMVSEYLEREQPLWFANLKQKRGEPRKYGSSYIFPPPEHGEEIEDRYEYEFCQSYVIDKVHAALLSYLYQETVSVSDVEQSDAGYYGKVNGKVTQLFFKSEDECEWELAGNFRPTNAVIDGDRLYVEW
jgi:hypothetical protein